MSDQTESGGDFTEADVRACAAKMQAWMAELEPGERTVLGSVLALAAAAARAADAGEVEGFALDRFGVVGEGNPAVQRPGGVSGGEFVVEAGTAGGWNVSAALMGVANTMLDAYRTAHEALPGV